MTVMTPDQNWTDEEWNNFRSQRRVDVAKI